MAHQSPSKVILCPQKPTAIDLKSRSWLQLLPKCGQGDTVKQPQWIPRERTLLHETWAVTTIIGLAPSTSSSSALSSNDSDNAKSRSEFCSPSAGRSGCQLMQRLPPPPASAPRTHFNLELVHLPPPSAVAPAPSLQLHSVSYPYTSSSDSAATCQASAP